MLDFGRLGRRAQNHIMFLIRPVDPYVGGHPLGPLWHASLGYLINALVIRSDADCAMLGWSLHAQGRSVPLMVIRKTTTLVYYPASSERTDLIRGSGRSRYVRGFLLVNQKSLKRQ
jgi:hypothetical protein